ncbi:MAG: polysaccharide pyruvyl transferase family protein, partial [Thermoanaerobaculia bacterium]
MAAPRRLLIIADVRSEAARHLGDEAMLEANLAALGSAIPGVTIVVAAREPAWVVARYQLEAVTPAAATVALAGADALVVSGGGNLSSSWPDLVAERTALLKAAQAHRKPAILLGQTLGPVLRVDERRLLEETLPFVRFLGVRELPSALLALALGVPPERLWYQADDALFLGIDSIEGDHAAEASPITPPEVIAVTIDQQLRMAGSVLFDALAAQLGALSRTTGAALVLVPHVFGGETSGHASDLTEARLLAARLDLGEESIAIGLDARGAARASARAGLVISTRYHPIVFGLGSGVASLGIHGDEYCRIKLEGALAHAGLERFTLSYEAVARGGLLPMALALWRSRGDVRFGLEAARAVWRGEARKRWEAVLCALDPAREGVPPESGTLLGRAARDVVSGITSNLETRREAWEGERARLEGVVAELTAQLGEA